MNDKSTLIKNLIQAKTQIQDLKEEIENENSLKKIEMIFHLV